VLLGCAILALASAQLTLAGRRAGVHSLAPSAVNRWALVSSLVAAVWWRSFASGLGDRARVPPSIECPREFKPFIGCTGDMVPALIYAGFNFSRHAGAASGGGDACSSPHLAARWPFRFIFPKRTESYYPLPSSIVDDFRRCWSLQIYAPASIELN
jgi:hypothetical protein